MSKTTKHRIKVPIYGAAFWLIVTDDIVRERTKMNDVLGEYEASPHDTGLCCYRNENFALFLRRDQICINIVAHEVFHLTHRIGEWSSINFDQEHHESLALLNGFLMEHVLYRLRPRYTKSFAS